MGSIVFFLPDVVGGVFSVINNLLQYAPTDRQVSVIAYSNECIPRRQVGRVSDKASFGRFSFHCNDNYYFIARRLFAKVPADLSCIVATDVLELLAIRLMRVRKPVVYVLMGDFQHYYDTAVAHQGVIDRYIAISREILDKLLALLPHRKDQIRLAYFSTPAVPVRRAAGATGRLKLIYVSRLEDGKNPLMLPQINRLLKAEGLEVEWTIVGDGPLRAELEKEIGNNANFRLAGFLSATELSREYRRHDIFILPSGHEGIPVSLIEAMKTGLAPIVSDISGGIREIVTNGNNGFLCPLGDAAAFAATIGKLNADRGLLEAVCSMAADFADKTFDPASCAERYWSVIREAEVTAGPKDFSAAPPGMLDSRWLPNPVVRLIRTIQTKRT